MPIIAPQYGFYEGRAEKRQRRISDASAPARAVPQNGPRSDNQRSGPVISPEISGHAPAEPEAAARPRFWYPKDLEMPDTPAPGGQEAKTPRAKKTSTQVPVAVRKRRVIPADPE